MSKCMWNVWCTKYEYSFIVLLLGVRVENILEIREETSGIFVLYVCMCVSYVCTYVCIRPWSDRSRGQTSRFGIIR